MSVGLVVSACAGPGYYFQAIGGHLELMRARENVSDVLSNPETDAALATRLRTTQELLAFAESRLDLPADGSYASYVETGRGAVVWNVIATPEFSLEAKRWCFPVAGCVPYRGYFEEEKARSFAERLRGKGLDVSVRGATAYSTLGWFSDPLLDTMLESDDLGLGATLFHELAHQRVYVRGDSAFNEAYASFVGREGVRAWLRDQGSDADLVTWDERLQAADDFARLQAATRTRLAQLYRGGGATDETRQRKLRILQDMRVRYEALVRDPWQGRDWFGGWFESPVNNADLSLFRDYHGGICAFERLFLSARGNFAAFHGLVEKRARMPDAERTGWLRSACRDGDSDIASGIDM